LHKDACAHTHTAHSSFVFFSIDGRFRRVFVLLFCAYGSPNVRARLRVNHCGVLAVRRYTRSYGCWGKVQLWLGDADPWAEAAAAQDPSTVKNWTALVAAPDPDAPMGRAATAAAENAAADTPAERAPAVGPTAVGPTAVGPTPPPVDPLGCGLELDGRWGDRTSLYQTAVFEPHARCITGTSKTGELGAQFHHVREQQLQAKYMPAQLQYLCCHRHRITTSFDCTTREIYYLKKESLVFFFIWRWPTEVYLLRGVGVSQARRWTCTCDRPLRRACRPRTACPATASQSLNSSTWPRARAGPATKKAAWTRHKAEDKRNY